MKMIRWLLIAVLAFASIPVRAEEIISNDAVIDTSYMALSIHDVLCGWSELSVTNTEKEGTKLTILKQKTFISMKALGQDIVQRQQFTYHIDDASGNFIYHDSYLEQGETTLSGVFSVQDGLVQFWASDGSEARSEPLSENTILPNTLYFPHLKRDFADTDCSEKTYRIFDVRTGRTEEITYTYIGEESLELVGSLYDAVVLSVSDPLTGGETRLWIDKATDIKLKEQQSSGLSLALTDREVTECVGTYNWDDLFFVKTNRFIENIWNIRFMKVDVRLTCSPAAGLPDLNVPGQRFLGTVDAGEINGIFELNHVPYGGENAPAFPGTIIRNNTLKQYLEPGDWIESDDPVLQEKAREITAGTTNAWEAVYRINQWVGEHISGLSTGSARETYDTGKGLCGEKARLAAAFCRAVGIPARVVWGCVYTPEYGGSFGHHAWNEVQMGSAGWIPTDATLREYDYVDSGHLRLGVLTTRTTQIDFNQIEILSYLTEGKDQQ